MARLCIKIVLALLVCALSVGPPQGVSATETSDEAFWLAAERACYADVHCMIRAVENAPPLPWSRGWENPEELFDSLKKARRFEALGLSESDGRQLLQAVLKARASAKNASTKPSVSEARMASFAAFLQPPAFPYRAPAEFEPLGAVLFRWPFDWSTMQSMWANMINICAQAGVKAVVWVSTPLQRRAALSYLQEQGVSTEHIRWVTDPTDSVWIRDYGPQVIRDVDSAQWGVVDFHYYDDRKKDDNTPKVIALGLQLPYVDRQRSDVVYTEGGNLNNDGFGGVVYSQRTYKRNPNVPPEEVDRRILSALQATKALVPKDPVLDGTGHVDMFMKIVRPDTVLMGQYNPDQIDYAVLEDNAALFARETNARGEPWRVVRIVQPDVYYTRFLVPVVRTYTNSLIINDYVIVPVYGIAEDEQALAVYREVLPEKTLVPLDARDIIPSGGAWHCVTMEIAVPELAQANH
uniref:Agmatine deiminase family protein n=1 Tax=Desulfatirhabdium butyrativorans TaxID=340467 RepID=A0A7C4RSV3_9BACT